MGKDNHKQRTFSRRDLLKGGLLAGALLALRKCLPGGSIEEPSSIAQGVTPTPTDRPTLLSQDVTPTPINQSSLLAPADTPTPQAYLPYVSRQTGASIPGQVVHVHDPDATNWSGSGWYGDGDDAVNQGVVDSMVQAGLQQVTGKSSWADIWSDLFSQVQSSGYQVGQKIAIKVNFNNTRLCDSSVTAIDALIEPVNAVAKGLVAMGVTPADICVYDAVRALPDRFVDNALYGISFFDGWREGICRTEAGFTYLPETQVHFHPPVTISTPEEHVTNVLMNASYLINMPIMKGGHPLAGVTLGFKNHFGTIHACSGLHDYVDVVRTPAAYRTDYNPMVDLLMSPLIGGKTVLTIGDALFAARQFAQVPVPWTTFENQLPNSLFFATDPVAVDCVMHDLIVAEPETLVPEGANNYLRLAAESGLGAFEAGNPWQHPYGAGYSRIDYIRIDM